MPQQLDLLASGQVIPTALHTEMQRSYLEYAMSVIIGRALPDVRDGLKPVHRRIIYAMHELGLTPDRPFRKCARVVGDVLGKYHPHGDQSVYDALVRMVQEFSSRYPLLAGHGNFGSVDDDPPAAMRYTETRLATIAQDSLLSEIGDATVDFTGNFDNSQQEPLVLPAQLPLLLLNGSAGIAVGMATNIPPHNLGEVVDGLIALIDQPQLTDAELFNLVPGPDFPTGGEVIDSEGIRDAYTTGRGSIPLRGVAHIEEVQPGRGRHRRPAIIVSELPYQVNKAAWIEKVAELVNQGRLEGVADVRDESDRDGMRVVVELKRESNPPAVLSQLYKLTPLQVNVGAILLAISDGQPRQFSLRELLQSFLEFREQTLIRRYTHALAQAESRSHLVEGLLTALDHLDPVIDILRRSADGTTAKATLQEQFNFSDRQVEAILAMPLRRLTGLERQNLQTEFVELNRRMDDLRRLLGDRRELLKALKKDLRTLKKKFGDARRTRIVANGQPATLSQPPKSIDASQQPIPDAQPRSQPPELLESYLLEPEDAAIELTQRGYIRRLPLKTFERQQRTRSLPEAPQACEDTVLQTHLTDTHQDLLVFTRSGKAHTVKVSEIPATPRSRGIPLATLLPNATQSDPETIVQTLMLPDNPEGLDLLLLTLQGRIKRVPVAEFTNLTGRGLIAAKLKDEDALVFVAVTQPGQQLILATSNGRVLRFVITDDLLALMSRAAQGLTAMRLGRHERLVGWAMLGSDDSVLLVTQQGYAKRLLVSSVKSANRGDLGMQVLQFANRTDALVGLVPVLPEAAVLLQTSTQRLIRLDANTIKLWGKEGTGELFRNGDGSPLIRTNQQEKIIQVAVSEPLIATAIDSP
jgi:DNA gyrase subunit A